MSTNEKIVAEYVTSLIIGVIFLYGFWQVIILFASNIPQIHKYGIAIVLAIFVALVNTIRNHSYRRDEQ